MNKLIELCQVQSPSHDDDDMRVYLYDELAAIEGVTFHDDGDNIYAIKGTAPYPCMVAHMDTVHDRVKGGITVLNLNGKLFAMDATEMVQVGVGGDDRVGIYVALQMLKEHPNMKVVFFRDEEVGCQGSALAAPVWFDDVTIVLQCDRKGNKDFITNASGVPLSSKTFQDMVNPIIKEYGYSFNSGMMTDVMQLKELGIKASMANISCGYYNPHSDSEYIDVADVHRVMLMVSHIIKSLGATFFPHIAPKKQKWNSDIRFWGGATKKQSVATNWWDEQAAFATNDSVHGMTVYCADCDMQMATHDNGLCDDCEEWRKDSLFRHTALKGLLANKQELPKINFASKPDYGQTRVVFTEAPKSDKPNVWKSSPKRKNKFQTKKA